MHLEVKSDRNMHEVLWLSYHCSLVLASIIPEMQSNMGHTPCKVSPWFSVDPCTWTMHHIARYATSHFCLQHSLSRTGAFVFAPEVAEKLWGSPKMQPCAALRRQVIFPRSGPLLMLSCVSVAPFSPTAPCNASDSARMSSYPKGMQEIQRMKSKLSLLSVILMLCAQLFHKPPFHP